jgi:hypothetical protein
MERIAWTKRASNSRGQNKPARWRYFHRATMLDLGSTFWSSPEWAFWVTDESGATVCSLAVRGTLGHAV